jgi:hypothetical protein
MRLWSVPKTFGTVQTSSIMPLLPIKAVIRCWQDINRAAQSAREDVKKEEREKRFSDKVEAAIKPLKRLRRQRDQSAE